MSLLEKFGIGKRSEKVNGNKPPEGFRVEKVLTRGGMATRDVLVRLPVKSTDIGTLLAHAEQMKNVSYE